MAVWSALPAAGAGAEERARIDPSRLDPRTRLILTVFAITAIAALNTAGQLGIAYAMVLAFIVRVRAGRRYLRWLRLLAVMLVVWFALVLYAVDLVSAVAAGLRLLALTSVFFLFFAVTRPEELADALVQSGLPYQAAFVVRAALQFVPVLSRNASAVFDAQRARGIPLDRGLRSVVHYPALFAPMLVQSFRLAELLAEAMESRGFGREGRTFRVTYRMKACDRVVITAAALGLALLFAVV